MEKNDALKAQSENGDALGGLSTEEIVLCAHFRAFFFLYGFLYIRNVGQVAIKVCNNAFLSLIHI